MKPMGRLADDPTVPASLRNALTKASREKASPPLLRKVLGAGAFAGVSAISTNAVGASVASKILGAGVVKGMAALAIFAAGAAVGGYTVHKYAQRSSQHDLRPSPGVVTSVTAQPTLAASAPVPAATVVVEAPQAARPTPPPPAVEERTAAPTALSSVERPREVESRVVMKPVVQAKATTPEAVPVPAEAVASAEAVVTPAPPPPPPDISTQAQLASLRSIQDALQNGQPALALMTIDAHRARFRTSVFNEELLLLEAQARWARQDASVCNLLDRFSATHPRSLLFGRVQQLREKAGCDSGGTRKVP